MRSSLVVLTIVLNTIFTTAYPSNTHPQDVDRRNIHNPEPLPPETQPYRLSERASIASNITIPQPLASPPTHPPRSSPIPMDLSISYALSSPCLLFLTSMLSSDMFTSCLPFALLLTTSTSYASLLSDSLQAGNLDAINFLIGYTASPQPSADQCDAYFSQVLSDMSKKDKCGEDLKAGTSKGGMALEAKNGIGNYQLVRGAEALINPDSGAYCYLEAVTSDRPDDLYLWSIPAGAGLPSTIKPTCSKCSALLLNHYAESVFTTSTLNGTLVQAAINTINTECGPAFATYHADAKTGGATATSSMPRAVVLGLIVVGSILYSGLV